MVLLPLLYENGGKEFVTTIEDINIRGCSGKANNMRYVNTIRGAPKDIAIKERDISYIY